jgi:membrane protease YdiL (CAAX protease family)
MTAATSTDARRAAIAFGMFLVWALGAWQSRTFGLWLAIGSTAVFLGVVASFLEGRALVASLLGVVASFVEGRALVASLRCEPRPLAIGAGFGLGMIVATKLVFTPLAVVLPGLVGGTRELYGAFGGIGPWAPFVLLPLVVAGEEVVWRGVVYRALNGRMKWQSVVLVGTALYGLAHGPTDRSRSPGRRPSRARRRAPRSAPRPVVPLEQAEGLAKASAGSPGCDAPHPDP